MPVTARIALDEHRVITLTKDFNNRFWEGSDSGYAGLASGSDRMEPRWDLVRDVQVTDGQVDHIGECLQVFKTTGPVFDDFQDTVDALALGIGQTGFDKRQDVFLMLSEGADEFP